MTPVDWQLPWAPPTYTVDRNGKVAGYVNSRHPHNWGRWGELDERGTLNLITPDEVRRATALVTSGRVVGCSIPIDEVMPVHPSRPSVVHTFGFTGSDMVAGASLGRDSGGFSGSDDYIFMPLQSATHWDGLAHVSWDGTLYNGFWAGTTGGYEGARRLGTHLLTDRLVGRGVLLDLPRAMGVERLQPGYAITAGDLDACAEAQGIDVGSGDILLVRTGEMGWFYSADAPPPGYFTDGHPGLSLSTAEWVHQRDIAALALDNRTLEVAPAEPPAESSAPLHVRLIRDLGLTVGELWWLDDLADACVEARRWEFLLVASPLKVMNASGAPISPVALF